MWLLAEEYENVALYRTCREWSHMFKTEEFNAESVRKVGIGNIIVLVLTQQTISRDLELLNDKVTGFQGGWSQETLSKWNAAY